MILMEPWEISMYPSDVNSVWLVKFYMTQVIQLLPYFCGKSEEEPVSLNTCLFFFLENREINCFST